MTGTTLLISGTSWGVAAVSGVGASSWNYSESIATSTGVVREQQLTLPSLVEARTGYRLVTDDENRSFADVLRRLQQHTQLDWGQIARTLGVSRRTVHNWLSGTRVSGANSLRLAAFYNAALTELTGVERSCAREFLLAPQAGGHSPLSKIMGYLQEAYPGPGVPVRAVELLQTPTTLDDPTISGGFDESIEIPELDGNGFLVTP